MHAKSALAVLAALSLSLPAAAATTTKVIKCNAPRSSPMELDQCNTGDAQCCNSVQKATDPSSAALLGLLGVVVQGVDALVGLGCTPISIIGAGQGANCAQQPVCCQDNSFNGLINVGCTPISL